MILILIRIDITLKEWKFMIPNLHHILFQNFMGTIETFRIGWIMKLHSNIPAKKASKLNIA